MRGHVFVCLGYQFSLFLRFFYCNLEMLRQCGIFCFQLLCISEMFAESCGCNENQIHAQMIM